MLVSLEISHFVLIKHVRFNFDKGLTVFTGETGSGKSVLFDALGLLLGERADVQMIRYGQTMSTIQGEFSGITDELRRVLSEHGIPLEDDSIWIKRVLYQDGKSKAFVNDMSVRTRVLKDIAPYIGEICGQFAGYRLLNASEYMNSLDQFALLKQDVALVGKAYQDMRDAERRYDDLQEKLEDFDREHAFLEHAVKELEYAITLGDEEELAQRCFVLKNGEKLRKALFDIEELLNGAGGILEKLDKSQAYLDRLPEALSDGTSTLYQSLDKAQIELREEALNFLRSYHTEDDDEPLEVLEERLFHLRGLARKYQIIDGRFADKLEEFQKSLETLTKGQDNLSELEDEINRYRVVYKEHALKVSEKRQHAAHTLQSRIMDELQFLKLENAAFAVLVRRDESQMTKYGMDQVQFLLSSHKGAPLLPLANVASGGEMSRILLALQVCLKSDQGLIVFDEIDSGMGGAAAASVGERLRLLSRSTQVFTITHAPQVAAKGDYHVRIEKQEKGDEVEAVYTMLSNQARVEEVARMLSGATITEEARSAAIKLLEN